MCASGRADEQFFEDYEEFQEILFKKQEELATRIGKIMDVVNLCELTIEELLEITEGEIFNKIVLRNRC